MIKVKLHDGKEFEIQHMISTSLYLHKFSEVFKEAVIS